MIKNLKIDSWLKVQSDQRMLSLSIDKDALEENSCLDGCYAIKTDLPKSAASKEVVHGRYKDLAMVELAFRTCKQNYLEVRPVYVRKEETTRGHVLVVMLAYMIVKQLRSAWTDLDLTPEEVKKLASLTCTKMEIKNMACCWKIPRPRKELKELLDALGIIMPMALPHRDINVDTRKNSLHIDNNNKSNSYMISIFVLAWNIRFKVFMLSQPPVALIGEAICLRAGVRFVGERHFDQVSSRAGLRYH